MALLQLGRANIAATGLALITIALSIWSFIEIEKYSLPFPPVIPLAIIIVTVMGMAMVWFGGEETPTKYALQVKTALKFTGWFIHYLPVILAVLSGTYAFPAEMLACRTETRWKTLFIAKDSTTVRSIQSRLQCCGFNSMRDRAYPFPSHDIDARTCERTFKYTTFCAVRWQNQLVLASMLCVAACVLVQILLLLIDSRVARSFWSAENRIQQSIGDSSERAGLLEAAQSFVRTTDEEEDRRRARHYPQI